jgi:hypothetical protein
MKRTVHLTDDNWSDYFGNTYAESLVEGVNVPLDGIDRDGPLVDRLLRWLARKNRRLKRRSYEMTRHDAAVLLELYAGWPGNNWDADRSGGKRIALSRARNHSGRPRSGILRIVPNGLRDTQDSQRDERR